MRVMLKEAAQASDFRKYVQSKLNRALDDVDVRDSNILVAAYVAPEKTAGGIIRPTTNVQQDIWQGKVGLILKMGAEAFKYTSRGYESKDEPYEVGDYVMYHASDARDLIMLGVACKIVDSSLVRMRASDPQIFY